MYCKSSKIEEKLSKLGSFNSTNCIVNGLYEVAVIKGNEVLIAQIVL